ncbi:VLRF1 family aeRF1-type release factor [Salinicoccus sp. YB14-2]|uniref:VLRF1 family aeRF1-type release factor n=1 Tax=Salinicoccus sp. YB14-2 TaxID=1572701 RepID=UPI000690BF34|nr:VLRF1 family aeRF1-type release factor [Salinicoccus sp. YB14-2]
MSVRKDIKRINEKEDDLGVLTLYLNTDASNPDLNNGEWKIHLKNEIKEMKQYADNTAQEPEKKTLKKLLKKVEDRVGELQRELQKGLMITASADGELWEEKILQVPVTTTLHWEKVPAMQQLQAMVQKYSKSAIIALQQMDARFIETELGAVIDEVTFSWDLNREDWLDYSSGASVGSRGSNQDHFERRFDENKNRWYKNLAPRLGKEIKDRGLEGAYLVGSNELVPDLEEHMHEGHLLGVLTKNIGMKPNHEIVSEIYQDLI